MQLADTNAALGAALGLLKLSGARFRLRDIHVDEVSLVDRAANKRRFLVVKGDNMNAKNKVSLSKVAKAAALGTLTEALEGLTVVVKAVQAADEGKDDDKALPAELCKGLSDVCTLLTGVSGMPEESATDLLAKFVAKALGEQTPTALSAESLSGLGSEAADKMNVLARVMALIADAESPMQLAEMGNRMLGVGKALKQAGSDNALLDQLAAVSAALIEEEKPSEDTVKKASTLAEALAALGKPAEGAGTTAPPAEGTTTPPPADGGNTPPPADGDGDGEGDDGTVAKMAEAVASGVVTLSKAGRKMSKPRLRKLRMAVTALGELLGELDDATILGGKSAGDGDDKGTKKRVAETTPQAPPKKPGDTSVGHGGPPDPRNDNADNLPAIADVLKRVEALTAEVKKMADTPEAPASRTSENAGSPGVPPNGQRPGRRVVW